MTTANRTEFNPTAAGTSIGTVMGFDVEELLLQAQDLGALLAWIEQARQLVAEVDDLAHRDPEVQARLQRDCPAYLCADWGSQESAGLQRVQMLIEQALRHAVDRYRGPNQAAQPHPAQ